METENDAIRPTKPPIKKVEEKGAIRPTKPPIKKTKEGDGN